MKTGIITGILSLLLVVACLIGEIRCIYKMVSCNWEPVGKSEILYTVGTFTGLGCIIGYLNIEDT